jgi:hypothetical protein
MGLIRYINQYYHELCYTVFGSILNLSGTALAGVQFYHAAIATEDVVRNGSLCMGAVGAVMALGSGVFVYNKAIKPMLSRAPQEEHADATLLDAVNNAIESKRSRTAKAPRDAPAGIENYIA